LKSQTVERLNTFRETATELGCDEYEERFDANVMKLAKAGGKLDADKGTPNDGS
jgi:hypothetical protein